MFLIKKTISSLINGGFILYSPNDIVHTDDILWLIGRIVDDGGARLHPHPLSRLTQETIVLAHGLAPYDYWKYTKRHDIVRIIWEMNTINVPILNC